MTVTETLKQKVDELELERRLAEASDAAEQAVHRALEMAGDYVHTREADIQRMLDKAGTAFDERTEGRYAERVAKVKEQVQQGLAKLAEHRPGADS